MIFNQQATQAEYQQFIQTWYYGTQPERQSLIDQRETLRREY